MTRQTVARVEREEQPQHAQRAPMLADGATALTVVGRSLVV